MTHRLPTRAIVVTWLLGTGLAVCGGQSTSDRPPYLNPDLAAEARAKDLISRMTLGQKVRQMQNAAPAIPDLGVPAYDWWNEALHGVARAGQATVFPQAIGLAATWDTDLMFRVADAISTEARAKYHDAIRQNNHGRYYGLTFWSPNINIFRDPRWGRGQETYGEDPFLTGRLAVAFIHGLQGNDPRYFKVVATAKHFAVHSGPESTRHSVDIQPSERDLNQTYLPAFRAAIVDGRAYSVMCAYNRVNGVPACANTDLIATRLRGDWRFPGYTVSDCGAIRDISSQTGHKFTATASEASAAAVKAGTDLTCGNEYVSLVAAVAAGQITEAEIDRSLERLFVARFKLGMFDPPERVPFSTIPYSEVDSAAHRMLALEAARKSIVLLKNDRRTLPLAAGVKTIAVIGPSADDPIALLGNYNGFSSRIVPPLEGLETQFAARATIRFALGATYVPGTGAASQAVVSSSVLTPPAGSGHGVLAEYFDNADLQDAPRLSRLEPRPGLAAVTDAAVTAGGIPARGYSVRWTGTLTAPVTGDYVFAARGGGQALRAYLDDATLWPETAPGARGQAAPQTPATTPLEAGHRYRLRVEYRQAGGGPGGGNAGGANVQLMWIPPAGPLLAEAVDAVRHADVTIAFVGLNPSLEGEQMNVTVPGFQGGDRTDLKLPAPQTQLLDAAFATGKPIVVVLTSGGAVAVNTAAERAAAVLVAWYGGEEIGTAIADTLAGINNPAGRLPVTFYRGAEQLPPFEDYSMTGRTYRYFSGDALYGFGYGLSYSTFQYAGLRAERTATGARVTARVKNDSPRAGDEVVQLYVGGGTAPDNPIRELKGFQRLRLAAGETREVEFLLGADALPPGTAPVRVSVGGGQPVGAIPHVDGRLTGGSEGVRPG
jgi:beta-glucosidase